MSAFMVSDRTLQVIAVFANDIGIRPLNIDKINAAVETLHAQNVASLRARYGARNGMESPPPPRLRHLLDVQKLLAFKPGVVLKACHCYAYQACETEGYWTSEAAKIVNRAEHNAGANVEGYADAPWGSL